eukprot:403372683
MLGASRQQELREGTRNYSQRQKQGTSSSRNQGRGQQNRETQSIFEGLKVAFLTGGSRYGDRGSNQQDDQQLMKDFRDQGGRVLDLNKLTRDNYRDALGNLDCLIVGESDTKLDQQTLGKFAQKLGVPRQEFQNMLRRAQEKPGQGFQVVSLNWLNDCLDEQNYIDPQQYQIRMKTGDQNENLYQEDEDEDYEGANEDTAYSNKYRSRTGGRSGQHIGHSKYTEGINFDEIKEEDLDPENNEEDRYILTQLRKSQSLRRVGTSSPYRNKDGTIDRRRVRDNDTDQDEDYDSSRQQTSGRQGQNQRSGGSQNQRRGGSQNQRSGGQSSYQQSNQNRELGQSLQGLRKGEATFVQEDVEGLNPEDFPPEYRNKDGSLDRRRFRHSKVKDQQTSGMQQQRSGGQGGRSSGQGQSRSGQGQSQSYGNQRKGQSQGRQGYNRQYNQGYQRSQGRGDEDEDNDDQNYNQQTRRGARSQSQGGGGYSRSQGRQGSSRQQQNYDEDDQNLRRNKDGSIDLRQFGPFNVERAPTGQLVPKGTVKDPINQYPDSKTKYRQSGISKQEYEHRQRTNQSGRRNQQEDNDEEEDDYDQNEDTQISRGGGRQSQQNQRSRQGQQQQKGYRSSSQNQSRGQQRQYQSRDQHMDDSHKEIPEDQLRRNIDGSIDLRQFGPFNVERAPTGQLVPKGTVEDPINQYPDSKTKFRKSGLSRQEYEHKRSQSQGRRQQQENLSGEDEDYTESDENQESSTQQRRGGRQQQQQRSGGQGQKQSSQQQQSRSGGGRSQQNSQRNRSQQNQRRQGDDEDESEHEKEKEELYEQDHDRRHLGPFNVDRAPTGQFVPKGSIRDPINKYKDSKEKGGPGKTGDRGSHSQKQGGGQRSGQSRDNEEEQSNEDEDTQQRQSTRRQGQKRSYNDMEKGGQGQRQQNRNRRATQDTDENDQDNEDDDDQENLESHQQDNRNRSRQVPKALMQTHTSQSQKAQSTKRQPLNDAILSQLEMIRDHYQEVNDQGRKIAYNKAIGELRKFDMPIESLDDLDELETIGANIRDHIREFIETGKVEGFEGKGESQAPGDVTFGQKDDDNSQQQQQQTHQNSGSNRQGQSSNQQVSDSQQV